MLEMMDAAVEGRLKALWAIGYDIALTNANSNLTKRALGSIDFVIVQDLFLNETAREYGSVFLPASSSFERDGTFMNAERRIQRIRKAIEPIGNARSDWEIICAVAAAMGHGDCFNYGSAKEIWDEVRSLWPAGQGITYERLEQKGWQWPCPTEEHPGTKVLHTEAFSASPRVALRRVPYVPSDESVDQEFSFLLTTGRSLYQFNAGTMTMRTRNAELRPMDLLDISPVDAARLNLIEGELVRIRSRYGETVLPVRITSAVSAGEVFATFQTPQVFLNRVTSPHRDSHVETPEYKVTAVEIMKHEAKVTRS
jgi:formate dehydrogenase major subunit